MCSDTTMKPCICFSVSLICFTSWAATTEGGKRESARSAENNTASNPQRLAAANPLRISDMAWVSILTPRCTLEFWPRHDGTARASVFDPNTYANTKPGSAIAAVSTHRLIQGDLISQGFFGSSISDMHCQCRRSDFENLDEA